MIKAEDNLPKLQRRRGHPISELSRLIEQLFAIESPCGGMRPESRCLARQRETRPVLERIEEPLVCQLHAALP
ncbi:hypothetical protein [Paraburkholderia sediminicola]|uniref:hypothetical protein n=1 Tax=Paraburkholderia sediminicola TaxID=458836 RepID=UPI0038BB94CA